MDLEKIKKAGLIASKARDATREYIKEGKSYEEILFYCEKKIIELGGMIAWVQLCPTTTAAHFSSTKDNNPICSPGDLIKLDLGVHIDGYIADTATSVLIEGGDENNLKLDLMKASRNALAAAEKILEPGVKLKELGQAQFSEAESMGFTTIKNLCGHTVDRWQVHGGLSIPTYNNESDIELEKNLIVAIEPFITDGKGFIKENGVPTIFMQKINKNTRSQQGRKVLDKIKTRNGLPFAFRDIEKELGKATSVLGIRDLLKNEIITSYPPLVEISNRPVAQYEHSFFVGEKTINLTK